MPYAIEYPLTGQIVECRNKREARKLAKSRDGFTNERDWLDNGPHIIFQACKRGAKK